MKQMTFCHPSAREGYTLTATVYSPEQAPSCVLVVLHGLAEHFGRYRRMAEALTARGVIVAGQDHLGHGASVKDEERGFFADKNGWETVCRDGASLVKKMRKQYPDLPIFLFGHSMGSFMARTIHLRRMAKIDGLVLSGTGNLSSMIVAGGKLVGKCEQLRLRGKNKVSALIASLALGPYDKPFKGEGKNAWISSMPEEVARYNADVLCGFDVKLGMFLDMFDGIGYIVKQKNVNLADPDIPILLLSGAQDPVGDMGKGVKAAFRAYGKAGVQDVSMILYEGCRHEIMNDTCREKAQEDLCAWLFERIG